VPHRGWLAGWLLTMLTSWALIAMCQREMAAVIWRTAFAQARLPIVVALV
jgi:hypothetical protein